ncbi:MAG: DNA cytosine methyltransferase [Chitinophagaceae bacterium]
MKRKFSHVELFAGCGGMSLGLESAGFDLVFANELSPMAANTFAQNILSEDIESLGNAGSGSSKVLWLSSKYHRSEVIKRLRENPFDFNTGPYTDLDGHTNFQKKLIVGDIKTLVKYFNQNSQAVTSLQKQKIDLLSGGPPCQSFSMAGKRVKNDQKNQLPYWFAMMADIIKPKLIVLENVKGILNPFKEDGSYFYAYVEVAKEFSTKGYMPVCMLLNAKYFSIPQNRPRFVMIGVRADVADRILKSSKFSLPTKKVLQISKKFYSKVAESSARELRDIGPEEVSVFNIEETQHQIYFNGELLPYLRTDLNLFVSTSEAIDDIKSLPDGSVFSGNKKTYPAKLNNIFKKRDYYQDVLVNHEKRRHSEVVKARFRLYQVLNLVGKNKQDISDFFITGKSSLTVERIFSIVKGYRFYFPDGKLRRLKNSRELVAYSLSFRTRKHSQRALLEDEASPAQLTIPDDVCHYDIDQLRTLTVREMARLQSFPDWFVFKSKATTGGKNRSFEVPQYSQVGNAVPPLLAYEVGCSLARALSRLY